MLVKELFEILRNPEHSGGLGQNECRLDAAILWPV